MNADKSAQTSSEPVVVSARDEAALLAEISRIAAFADRIPDARLQDVAYTCSLGKGECVLGVVASSVRELHDRLLAAKTRIESGQSGFIKDKGGTYWTRNPLLGEGRGKLAFMFPGAVSFYPNMMSDLAVAFPECRGAFDELEEALAGEDGFRPSDFIFPPAPQYAADLDAFSSGAYSQAFISAYAGCAAMTRLLETAGVEPDGVVGFGGGDLAAVLKAGAAGENLSRQQRIQAIGELYGIVRKAVDHEGLPETVMLTVLPRREEDLAGIEESFPKGGVCLAVDFSPKMKTYAIEPALADEAAKRFADAGARTIRHGLDRPFNTPKCAKVVSAVHRFASSWLRTKPVCDMYSCAAARLLAPKPRTMRNDVAERWAMQVRFSDTVRQMHRDGYRVFLEVGPRGLLAGAVSETLKDETFAAIATNSIHRRGMLQMQHALARLASLGAKMDISPFFAQKGAKKLDFDSKISVEFRSVSEKRLSREFPKLTLLGPAPGGEGTYAKEPAGRGARAAVRAAAISAREGKRLQFTAGLSDPLISDAPPSGSVPGVSYRFSKIFRFSDAPFIADFAYGSSQLSYSDPALKGFVTLPIPLATEIMAEAAQRVIPNRHLAAVENFVSRRTVHFEHGALKLSVNAERVSASDPAAAAVKVQIRADAPGSDFTWPAVEAVFVFAQERPAPSPVSVAPLAHARTVHWSGRDIYPSRIGAGRRLRGIVFAESWGENGIDYTVEVPRREGCLSFTRLPVWAVNPLLLQVVAAGFGLWRCSEKFAGAFSFPIRFRRLELRGSEPKDGSRLNCYLRLTGVTPSSHVCDITASDGNGNVAMQIEGWEENTERVPKAFCDMVLQPATCFATDSLPRDFAGGEGVAAATSFVDSIPYKTCERNEELWLKILGSVTLGSLERGDFAKMKGSAARRTEWLFGRIVAKEAVRRYLKDFHQARWSYADVQILPDANGKPQAMGAWADNLTSKLDVAIAHTSLFSVAVAAANRRAGVDVEPVSRNLSAEFVDGVFSPEEKELAVATPDSSCAMLRFWCAKEALSKALGTGIRYSPKGLSVCGYDSADGTASMRLLGDWLGEFKSLAGVDIPVGTHIFRDHVLAFCLLHPSLVKRGDDEQP